MPLSSLSQALLLDAQGNPTDQHLELKSKDWDEIDELNRHVYMPYRYRSTKSTARPDSTHHTYEFGDMILSRFAYGTGVVLDEFDPQAGRGIVMTTLRGNLLHCDGVPTRAGESFLIDAAKTDYRVAATDDHLQLNLSFDHNSLDRLFEQLYGYKAAPNMWKLKFKFGGEQSSWVALLEYAARLIAERANTEQQRFAMRHLEETLGMAIISEWTSRFGTRAPEQQIGAVPRVVKKAEEFMRDNLFDPPTRTEIAAHCGVSVRTLSDAFRKFKNVSPMEYLKQLKYEGVYRELLENQDGCLRDIAGKWGIHHMSLFSREFKKRYGVLPSELTRSK